MDGITLDQLGHTSERHVTILGLDSAREAAHDVARLCPLLESLRLRQSTIASFRDLGCGLERLRVLHAARCAVTDLDGLASLGVLEELYLPFNDVADCAALTLHETLQVVDLESNRIADSDSIVALGTCPRLSCLTLHGNPVARDDAYAQLVADQIPQLDVLDDCDVDTTDDLLRQESAVVAEAIKRFRPTISTPEPPNACSSHTCWDDMLHLRGAVAYQSPTADSSSSLTHGDAAPFSGNIAKDMRRRRRRGTARPETTTDEACRHDQAGDPASSSLRPAYDDVFIVRPPRSKKQPSSRAIRVVTPST